MKRLSKEEFVTRSNNKHSGKYDYSLVDYINNSKKVIIVCDKHGKFLQSPTHHLKGSGCKKCANVNRANLLRHSSKKFIEKAEKVHNGRYNYKLVNYVGDKPDVTIICKKHGVFTQSPSNHLAGKGCYKCGVEKVLKEKSSRKEKDFLFYMKVPLNLRGVPIGKYFVDGLVGNVVYEFLGDYWHGNPEVYLDNSKVNLLDNKKRTMGELFKYTTDRFETISNMGYDIVYVWEKDWDKFILDKKELKLNNYEKNI